MRRIWNWFLGVLARIAEGEELDDPEYEDADDAAEYFGRS